MSHIPTSPEAPTDSFRQSRARSHVETVTLEREVAKRPLADGRTRSWSVPPRFPGVIGTPRYCSCLKLAAAYHRADRNRERNSLLLHIDTKYRQRKKPCIIKPACSSDIRAGHLITVGRIEVVMKAKKGLPISLPEYRLIWSVMHSVRRAIGEDSGRACLFYNVIGAYLLEHTFRISARPLMGVALVRVHDPTATVLTFAERDSATGELHSSPEGFHCWVETEAHVLDFTAPTYREELLASGQSLPIPRRMFQREKAVAAASPEEVTQEGDFLVLPNAALTNLLLGRAAKSMAVGDLAKVCLSWLRRPPKRTPTVFLMQDDRGETFEMQLAPLRLEGAW